MKQLTVSALAFLFAVGLSVTLAADLEQGDHSASSIDTTTDLSVEAGDKEKEKCDKKKKKCDRKKEECDKKKKDCDKS